MTLRVRLGAGRHLGHCYQTPTNTYKNLQDVYESAFMTDTVDIRTLLARATAITSSKNTTIKTLVRLKTRKYRQQEGRFLIEGMREVSRAVAAGVRLEGVYLCAKFAPQMVPDVGDVPVFDVSDVAFTKLSLRQSPDGVIAVAQRQQKTLETLPAHPNGLYLVIDGLEKPGNIGALLRTADSAGVDAVFVTGTGTDLENPNVIRASMGSVFRQVIACDTNALRDWLLEHQVQVIATSPQAEKNYWQQDYVLATAIVLGTEHEGLGEGWLEHADIRVVIPMFGSADSLNVATSGALLLYEALRQRHASGQT